MKFLENTKATNESPCVRASCPVRVTKDLSCKAEFEGNKSHVLKSFCDILEYGWMHHNEYWWESSCAG